MGRRSGTEEILLADIAIWVLALGLAVACAAAYLRGYPGAALGGLLVAAAFSGVTAKIGSSGVRLEQPTIVVLTVLVVLRKPQLLVDSVRRAWLPIGLILVYLGANVVSAALSSPDVLQSLKVTLWLAVSIIGGLLAMVLIVGPDRRGTDSFHRWIIGAAIVSTGVAALQVLAEAVLKSTWGVLQFDAPLGKASGLAWEPNLLSIYLAMAMTFLLIPPASLRLDPRSRWASIVVIGVGMALALSRGGLVALVVGLVLGVVLVAGMSKPRVALRSVILPGLIAVAIAVSGYAALDWLGERGVGLKVGRILPSNDGPLPSLVVSSPEPGPGASGIVVPPSTSAPGPAPSPQIGVSDDTIGIRFRNLTTAIEGGIQSPILGVGPDTFGLRYQEPTCLCPAHIPNQLSATFYETGMLGLASLVLAFALVVIGAVRARRPDLAVALIVLAVGYQFTDAIRFATLWLVIGIAIGVSLIHAEDDQSIMPTDAGTA